MTSSEAGAPAPAAPAGAPDPLDDPALRRALAAHDRRLVEAATAAIRDLAPGPCPGCEGGRLEARAWPAPWDALARLLLGRPTLACAKCGLEAPAVPSPLGLGLGLAGAAALVVAGLQVILAAQQLTAAAERNGRFALGALLLLPGAQLGSAVWAAWQGRLAALRLVSRLRTREAGGLDAPRATWLQENLRELAFAAVLFLGLRHVAIEAFVIPTGSMAPTLYGNHFRVACARCGFPFALGKGEHEAPPETVRARCPVCDEQFVAPAGPVAHGNKILVNKLAYRVGAPGRWDVVVFRYPSSPQQSYIKRLVGLPGETIRIENGDVFVDGRRARKPDPVQDAIWIPVVDGRRPWPGADVRWLADPASADAWDVATDGARLTARPGPGGPAWVTLRGPGPQGGVTDYCAYNRHGDPAGDKAVADLRVLATLEAPADAPEGSTALLAVVENHAREVVATFPIGRGRGTYLLRAGERELARFEGPALAPGRRHEVALAYADDRARLIVGGRALCAGDDDDAPARTDHATVRVGAAGPGALTWREVRVDRDVHYVPLGSMSLLGERFDPAQTPVTVPADGYLVLGDNSPSSLDSRAWGFVRAGHLLGRAFLVWWPLWPFEGRLVR